MGDIVPFLAKVRASGDWTAAERLRLDELGDRLSAVAEGVEVVFGATDEGDPWCVVKDAQDEILVHVARIGGRFIVHFALDDGLSEGADLPTLLSERLGWEEEELVRDDVVVPFSRQAQSLLALIIATAFFYETQKLEHGDAATGEALPIDPHLGAEAHAIAAVDMGAHPVTASATTALDELAASPRSFAAAEDPAPTPGPNAGWSTAGGTDLPAYASQADAPQTSAAPAAASLFAGTMVESAPVRTIALAAPFTASATSTAADPPGGAGMMGFTAARQGLVEGGDGKDIMKLDSRTVTAGGGGGDIFVLQAPDHMGDAGVRLGIVADFHAELGDRLVTEWGKAPAVLATTATTMVITAVPSVLRTADGYSPGAVMNGRHLEVDLDGDGKADGYVVLLDPPAPPAGQPHAAAAPIEPEASVILTGQALEHYAGA